MCGIQTLNLSYTITCKKTLDATNFMQAEFILQKISVILPHLSGQCEDSQENERSKG